MSRARLWPLLLVLLALPVQVAAQETSFVTTSTVNLAQLSTEVQKVCLQPDGKVCVPMSVLRATFEGWQDGDISPLAREQAAHSQTYARWRDAEHTLAQVRADLMRLLAPKEAEGLTALQANWLKAVQAAAPPGTVYDDKAGKYVPKPAGPEKPKGGGMP